MESVLCRVASNDARRKESTQGSQKRSKQIMWCGVLCLFGLFQRFFFQVDCFVCLRRRKGRKERELNTWKTTGDRSLKRERVCAA